MLYSRITPFGFVEEKDASDEDLYYAEPVTLLEGQDGEKVMRRARKLRQIFETCRIAQTTGGNSQAQAEEMAKLLLGLRL